MKINFDWKAPVNLSWTRSNFPVGSWAKFGDIIYIVESWNPSTPHGTAIMIDSDRGVIRHTTINECSSLTGTKITAPSEIKFSW